MCFVHRELCIHRMVHGFTCAGILVSQYTNIDKCADVGSVGHAYIRQGWRCCLTTMCDKLTHLRAICIMSIGMKEPCMNV